VVVLYGLWAYASLTFEQMKNNRIFQWRCRDRLLTVGQRPLIMGILNVTPDSFSDGGEFLDWESAVSHGVKMMAEGADIIDVGGESTRPGAADVPADKELERVLPVIQELAKTGAVISVDTMKAVVARDAIEAGARIINDVSALEHDPAMADVVRGSGAGVILMHMPGTPRNMQNDPRYADVVADVRAYLNRRIEDLVSKGITRDAMAVDPGIGFGKTVDHNLQLLANLNAFAECNRPLVLGLSRKSFLGKLTGSAVEDRLAGSLAALVFCILNGAHIMRVHDVKESCDAVRVAAALEEGRV
jgi:dihydropteroate synthase